LDKSDLIVRTNKYRIYPNAVQKSLLFNLFSNSRFIWNNTLGRIKDGEYGMYKTKDDRILPKIPSMTEIIKYSSKLKQDYEFIKIANDFSQAELYNLYMSLREFKRKPERGYPKFKSRKHDYGSISSRAGFRIKIKDNHITLPSSRESQFNKSDHILKFKKHQTNYEIEKITGISIKKDNLDRYWLTVTGYTEPNVTSKNKRTKVGIDVGLKELLTCSDGTVVKNKRFTIKYHEKLVILQRRLSKKKRGSKNRTKARIKVAKCHDKIKNCRNYNNHVISRNLINIYDFIGLESLSIQDMMKNKQLSKSIQDVSWYQIISNLKYKASENQTSIVQINRWFPSSKTCSKCGNIKSDLKLSDRTYHCSECGLEIDRDLNASINIYNEASRLQSLSRNTRKDFKNVCGVLNYQNIEAEKMAG